MQGRTSPLPFATKLLLDAARCVRSYAASDAGLRDARRVERRFCPELREINLRPHLARSMRGPRSATDRQTTRHPGYAVSQRIEEAFGGSRTVAGSRKTRFRGLARLDLASTLTAAARNLVRLPKLLAAPP